MPVHSYCHATVIVDVNVGVKVLPFFPPSPPFFPVFLTGTDRIPINGFERMGVMIQRMDGGPNFDKLPVAHTCFNILDLPPYPTKEKMRDKLLQATNFTTGFGII
jgi:hypothetical protein